MVDNLFNLNATKIFQPNQKMIGLHEATKTNMEIHPEIAKAVSYQNEILDLLSEIVSGNVNSETYEHIKKILDNQNFFQETLETLKLKVGLDETMYKKFQDQMETGIEQQHDTFQPVSDDTILYSIRKEKLKKAQGMVNRRENIQANITKVTNEMIVKKELVPNTLNNLTAAKETYLQSNLTKQTKLAEKEDKTTKQLERIKKLRQLLKDVDDTMKSNTADDVDMENGDS